MNDQELRDEIREARRVQTAELQEIREALPVLAAIARRYSGSRDGNRIATRARRASAAISELLEETES